MMTTGKGGLDAVFRGVETAMSELSECRRALPLLSNEELEKLSLVYKKIDLLQEELWRVKEFLGGVTISSSIGGANPSAPEGAARSSDQEGGGYVSSTSLRCPQCLREVFKIG